jgi:pimeloyl-ACP methyl ester carboxylesterase
MTPARRVWRYIVDRPLFDPNDRLGSWKEFAVSTASVSSSTGARSAAQVSARGHIGLVVLGAIASGLLSGLVLVLAVLAGGPEHEIIGAALVALGVGFVVLAGGSRRFTDQPQSWALLPAVASTVAGVAIWALAPGDRTLTHAGWVWPELLLVLVIWSVRGARQVLHNWSRRAVLYPCLFVLLLVAAGGAFQTVSAATSSNLAPDPSYLVDGHSLYLHCVGTGEPTVVLFNGLGERTPSWAWVQQSASSTTRVCAFDRAGEGWSGAAPGRQDGDQLASDLHGLLRAAHIPGPYVLAGHSVGGVYALVYAAQYPGEVAGVALIDSPTPYQFDLPDYPGFYSMGRRLYSVMPTFARAGIAKLTAASQFGMLPQPARRQARAFASSPRELRADHVEFAELATVFEQAKALKSLDGTPLAVLTAGVGEQRGWAAAQKRLAKLSGNSEQRTVIGATHAALLEDKEFASITSRAITQLVRSTRSAQS